MKRVFLTLLTVAALLSSCTCSREPAQNPPVAERPRQGGTDVTFIFASDTHFGIPGMDELNKKQIAAMNSFAQKPGRNWPASAGGGAVAAPLGVIVAGDLTDNGMRENWNGFLTHYGRAGEGGLLNYPLYECTGNHDRMLGSAVLDVVRKRHGDLTYSWDWGDLHVVCLDEYPSAANRAFLQRDLAKVGRDRPIIIYFHYPLLGLFSDWWSQGDKDAFADAIKGYNVVAIFNGHYHVSGHYVWNGYNAYRPGSPRHTSHSFCVVRVTDRTLTVGLWNWERDGWEWCQQEPINRKAATQPAGS